MSKPFDPTKPVQTRDGRKARILATDLRQKLSIVACVDNNKGSESLDTYSAGGLYWQNDGESPHDLINVPVKHVLDCWLNIYPSGNVHAHLSKKAADAGGGSARIACLHVRRTYAEGDDEL